MKVLITGGAGFIGSTLAKILIKEGHEVRLLDTSSCHENFFKDETLLPGATKIQGSILDPNCLVEAMRGCDTVVHLAARLGVKRTDSKRLACLNVNINGTTHVLEACAKARVKHVVFSSSSEVYGNATQVPITEETPLNPVSVYAASKIAGEEYVKAYAQEYGMTYTIFRFFNVYGVGQVAQFVVPKFVRSVIQGDVPTVFGEGNQTRAFCYVDDVASGIALALGHSAARNQTFNIGNPAEPISMMDLAKKVLEIAKVKKDPRVISMENSDRLASREIHVRYPDISKIQNLLGYQPSIPLAEGIHRLFEYRNIPDAWDDMTLD